MLAILSLIVWLGVASALPADRTTCICPVQPTWAPVCGTDGHTYPNVEALECMRPCVNDGDLEVAYDGMCKKKIINQECLNQCVVIAMYDPVCGTNGKTYSNEAELGCHQRCGETELKVDHKGQCELKPKDAITPQQCLENCPDTADYTPVCGTDGKTYENVANLGCHQECIDNELQVAHKGKCEEEPKMTEKECLLDCPVNFDINPICGTDGKTYINYSTLKCHQKCVNSELEVAHMGECKSKRNEMDCLNGCAAITLLDPVCGTDSKTYTNMGVLECHHKCVNSDLKLDHKGPCENSKMVESNCLSSCPVTLDINPICGTDGKTYDNISWLKCQQKCVNSELEVAYEGECHMTKNIKENECLNNCVAIALYDPVCGTDGKTYTNMGELHCHQTCENEDLEMAHKGFCSL